MRCSALAGTAAPLVPAIQIEVKHRDESTQCHQFARILVCAPHRLLATTLASRAACSRALGFKSSFPSFSSVQLPKTRSGWSALPISGQGETRRHLAYGVKMDGGAKIRFRRQLPSRRARRWSVLSSLRPTDGTAPRDGGRHPRNRFHDRSRFGLFHSADGYA